MSHNEPHAINLKPLKNLMQFFAEKPWLRDSVDLGGLRPNDLIMADSDGNDTLEEKEYIDYYKEITQLDEATLQAMFRDIEENTGRQYQLVMKDINIRLGVMKTSVRINTNSSQENCQDFLNALENPFVKELNYDSDPIWFCRGDKFTEGLELLLSSKDRLLVDKAVDLIGYAHPEDRGGLVKKACDRDACLTALNINAPNIPKKDIVGLFLHWLNRDPQAGEVANLVARRAFESLKDAPAKDVRTLFYAVMDSQNNNILLRLFVAFSALDPKDMPLVINYAFYKGFGLEVLQMLHHIPVELRAGAISQGLDNEDKLVVRKSAAEKIDLAAEKDREALFQKGMEDKDSDVIRIVAQKLSPTTLLKYIKKYRWSEDPLVVSAMSEEINRLPAGEERAQLIQSYLDSNDETVQHNAVAAIPGTGKPFERDLYVRIFTGSPMYSKKARLTALSGVLALEDDSTFTDVLVMAMGNADWEIQKEAAIHIAFIKSEENRVRFLEKAIQSRNDWVLFYIDYNVKNIKDAATRQRLLDKIAAAKAEISAK